MTLVLRFCLTIVASSDIVTSASLSQAPSTLSECVSFQDVDSNEEHLSLLQVRVHKTSGTTPLDANVTDPPVIGLAGTNLTSALTGNVDQIPMTTMPQRSGWPFVTSRGEKKVTNTHSSLTLWFLLSILLFVVLIALLAAHSHEDWPRGIFAGCRCRCHVDLRFCADPTNWFCCGWVEYDDRDISLNNNEVIGEDTYGFVVASIIRDTHYVMHEGAGIFGHRFSRMCFSMLLLIATVSLQYFLLSEIWELCLSKRVHDLRESYDEYEFRMYGSDERHTYLNRNMKHRGLPEYFQPELFNTLPNKVKTGICNTPFSQPLFFLVVIFIWTLRCVGEIKAILDMFFSLVVHTPTTRSMADALNKDPGMTNQANIRLLMGLTSRVKVVLVYCVMLPRAVLTCYLLWLGCRLLAASFDFSELVLFCLALEFILMLKDLLYNTLVSARSKSDLQNIEVRPARLREPAGYWAFLGTFFWAVIAIAWCLYYTYVFQGVLPDFKWDVHDICWAYVKDTFTVNPYKSKFSK